MSGAELIARLRESQSYEWQDPIWETRLAAADRIEALTKERDEADDLAKAAFADGASNNIRLAETSYRVKWLEAKLAKAVEALGAIVVDDTWGLDHDVYMMCRATLAEIKGESHE